MKKLRKPYALVMSAMLIASGCGPWSSSNTREVRVAIPGWGNPSGLRTQEIPAAAVKITVKITGSGMAPIEKTIDRSGTVTAYGVVQPTVSPTATPTATPTPAGPAGTVIRNFSVPTGALNPTGIVIDNNGFLWVTNNGSNNISQYDSTGTTAFNQVSFATGSNPFFIAIDRSTNTLWATLAGANDVARFVAPTTITAGNITTVDRFPVGANPRGIAVDSSRGVVWVGNFGDGTVTRLSTSTGAALGSPITVGANPSHIAVDSNGTAWVAINGSNIVARVSAAGTFAGSSTVGTGPSAVAIDQSGNAWVTNAGSNSVSKLDNAGNPAGAPFPVTLPGSPTTWVAIDNGGNAWVTVQPNQLFRISAAGTLSGPFTVNSGPAGIAIDRNNPSLYVANNAAATITQVSSGGPLGVLSLGAQQLPLHSPSPLPSPGVFDANSTVVVLKFQVPIGDNRLLEATAFGPGDHPLVGAKVLFNVPASGTVPDVEVNMTTQGLLASAEPTVAPTATPTATATPTPSPTPFTITGRWVGPVTASPGGPGTIDLNLTQSGTSFTGTSIGVVTGGRRNGTFSGTLSGTSFTGTFTQINPCSVNFAVTGSVSGNNMTYSETGSDCAGAAQTGTANLTLQTTTASTAGTSLGTFTVGTSSNPDGVAVDSGGNIWVANSASTVNNVVKLDPTNGTILNTISVSNGPFGVAIDSGGNVWVTQNNGASTVTKLSNAGANLGTFTVSASNPQGIAIDNNDNVWVVSANSDFVSKLDKNGASLFNIAMGTTHAGVAVDPFGNAWVTDNSGNVFKVSSSGSVLGSFGVGTTPIGIAVDISNNVWVTNFGSNNVAKLSNSGALLDTFPVGTNPQGIAIDNAGNSWVTNANGNNVTLLASNGSLLGTFSVGSQPRHIAIDRNRTFAYVTNEGASTVTKLSTGGPLGALSLRTR